MGTSLLLQKRNTYTFLKNYTFVEIRKNRSMVLFLL